MPRRLPLRWVAIGIFTLASALNYLDRQVLAALAPVLKEEFRLSNADYGMILSAFSITYAASAPLAGLFIDRVGLNLGISVSVALWSAAGVATGFVRSFGGLLGCRAALGIAESGGIPGSGKAVAIYLPPQERALGAASSQMGLSAGAVAAPLLASWLAVRYGWRSAFVLTGLLGFLWIPVWLFTARKIPRQEISADTISLRISGMMADRRLWGLVAANILAMTVYSLWTNWTTVYLVETHGMSPAEANRRLAWIPPVFANLGGLAGGWLAWRWIRSGVEVIAARIRVCLLSALVLLLTAAIPFMPTASLATAAICLSFFWSTCLSVNLYSIPLDIFGAGRAAFGVAALTFAYGLMQTFISPAVGALLDRYGFGPVCGIVAALPLASVGVLKLTEQPS